MRNLWWRILRASVRTLLLPLRLLQGELARLRLARHGNVSLTVGIAAGMLFSLWGVHTFGYRRLPSLPVPGTATKARQFIGAANRGHASRGARQPSLHPDRGEDGANGTRDVEG